MAFLCNGDEMLLASEGGLKLESKIKMKAPKSSYEINTVIPKNSSDIIKVDIKPTKGIFDHTSSIPNWLDITYYSIPKKKAKRITAVHILNKCLTSKNPYKIEPDLILYCHENEIDLLRILPFLIDISIQMKCDIVSFDYQGFGHIYDRFTKPNNSTLFIDGEVVLLDFCINYLKYKIENIILFGKELGAMIGIYLSSMNRFNKCKSLILYNPLINSNGQINIKLMRSINCKSLLIYEIENKDEIEQNDIIYLCREIPNQQEWLPLKKENSKNINKFSGFKKYLENSFDDVYMKHRRKFILKLRDYVCQDEENIKTKKKGSSSMGESTSIESNHNLSMNKNSIIEDIEKSEEKDLNENNNIFDQEEIHIENNDDY